MRSNYLISLCTLAILPVFATRPGDSSSSTGSGSGTLYAPKPQRAPGHIHIQQWQLPTPPPSEHGQSHNYAPGYPQYGQDIHRVAGGYQPGPNHNSREAQYSLASQGRYTNGYPPPTSQSNRYSRSRASTSSSRQSQDHHSYLSPSQPPQVGRQPPRAGPEHSRLLYTQAPNRPSWRHRPSTPPIEGFGNDSVEPHHMAYPSGWSSQGALSRGRERYRQEY